MQDPDTAVRRRDILVSGEFTSIPLGVLAHPDLNPAAKVVYAALLNRLGRNKAVGGGCGTLARATGMSPRTVRSALKELARAGLIRVDAKRGCSARVRFHRPPGPPQREAPAGDYGRPVTAGQPRQELPGSGDDVVRHQGDLTPARVAAVPRQELPGSESDDPGKSCRTTPARVAGDPGKSCRRTNKVTNKDIQQPPPGEGGKLDGAGIEFAVTRPDGEAGSWSPPAASRDELAAEFAGVDVPFELKRMAGWLRVDPARRRPAADMPALLWDWLDTARQRGGRAKAAPAAGGPGRAPAPRSRERDKLTEVFAALGVEDGDE